MFAPELAETPMMGMLIPDDKMDAFASVIEKYRTMGMVVKITEEKPADWVEPAPAPQKEEEEETESDSEDDYVQCCYCERELPEEEINMKSLACWACFEEREADSDSDSEEEEDGDHCEECATMACDGHATDCSRLAKD